MKKETELLIVVLVCVFISVFLTWLSMKQYYEDIVSKKVSKKQELVEFYQEKWILCGEYNQELWNKLFDCLRGKAVNKTCVVMHEGDTLLTNKTIMITPYEHVIVTANGTVEACWEHGTGIFTTERRFG